MRSLVKLLYPDWPAPSRVKAFATTRLGGVSAGPYASFNLADHVGDDAECVRRNRELLRAYLPAEPVWLTQVHGATVIDAARAHAGVRADGAFARTPGVVCAVLTADCLPIFLCRRDGSAVALLHGGWRGLAAGIIEQGLAALGAPADEILAWLGPAIGAQAYEVGDEVRQAFVEHDAEAAPAFSSTRPGKWRMGLHAIARRHLNRAGVSAVRGGDYCTASQADLFFSYRRDETTGRMASLIWIE